MLLVRYIGTVGSIFTLKNNIIRKTGLFITFSMTLTFNIFNTNPDFLYQTKKLTNNHGKLLLSHNGNGKLYKNRICTYTHVCTY